MNNQVTEGERKRYRKYLKKSSRVFKIITQMYHLSQEPTGKKAGQTPKTNALVQISIGTGAHCSGH